MKLGPVGGKSINRGIIGQFWYYKNMLNYLELREKRIREYLIPKPIKEGSGLINSLIDNMPIEAHLPGMQYAGPVSYTHLTLPTIYSV